MTHLLDNVGTSPFWWDAIDTAPMPKTALPDKADVAIVGAGYTGLSAAAALANGGRSVAVLEAGEVHGGASTRNGGQAAGQVKPTFTALIDRLGLEQAVRVYQEARETLDYLDTVVTENNIDCAFGRVGRLQPAFTAGDFQAMQRESGLLERHLGIEAELLEKNELHREIGSDYYCGAMLRPDMGAVQPALLHRGLLRRAQGAGAEIVAQTPVNGIVPETGGFRVVTARGEIRARDVIVATNGYTGNATPWLQRRIIPIRSQIIGTEPIATSLMAELIPRQRMVVDTCRLHHYYRPSPDGQRILLGGRAVADKSSRRLGRHLYHDLLRIFPQLQDVRISHVWSGITGYSFDYLPHIGQHDGIHYALAFCGGGVTWGPYLGNKVALQVLDSPDAQSVFADQNLTTRPLYTGRPWFLPVVLNYYRLRDRLAA